MVTNSNTAPGPLSTGLTSTGKGNDPNCLLGDGGAAVMETGPASEVRAAWAVRDEIERLENQGKRAQAARLRSQLAELESLLGGRAFRVPADQVEELQKAVDRAGKAAIRTGNLPPSMHVADSGTEIFEMGGGVRVGREMAWVIVAGAEASPGEGWRFVGTLEHRRIKGEAATVIRRLPGEERADLDRFAEAEAFCEHCNLRRKRNDTFLVSGPDGDIRQVGRACLGAYIGSETPEKAARYAELVLGVVEKMSGADRSSRSWAYGKLADPEKPSVVVEGRAASTPGTGSFSADPLTIGSFDPKQYLAFAAAEARRNGWVSRKIEREQGKTATATAAQERMFAALRGDKAELPSADDHAAAEEALTWVRDTLGAKDRTRMTEFERNMLYVADAELVRYRQLPVLAAAISMHAQAKRRAAEAAASPSRPVGEVGKMHETTLKVTGKRHRETQSGFPQTVYTMQDAEGNVFSWFSSAAGELDEGAEYRIRGKIKRHSDFRGVAQTVLERCKILS